MNKCLCIPELTACHIIRTQIMLSITFITSMIITNWWQPMINHRMNPVFDSQKFLYTVLFIFSLLYVFFFFIPKWELKSIYLTGFIYFLKSNRKIFILLHRMCASDIVSLSRDRLWQLFSIILNFALVILCLHDKFLLNFWYWFIFLLRLFCLLA